jgi:protein-disulfide isomerase
MTNLPPEDHVNAEPVVSRTTPPLDSNKLSLPMAVLIAGVLISGTIFYTNKQSTTPGAQKVDETKVLSVANLKKWAKEIKLDTKKFNECFDNSKYETEIQKDEADGAAAGVTGTPAFFVNGYQVIGAQPFSVFKDVIDQALAGKKTITTNMGRGAEQLKYYNVSIDDDPVLGKADAPVTIVEFSDFQCPYCKQYFDNTFGQIKAQYIDTGKVKLVYRDFPLSFHPMAEPSAEAANCAMEQGKFWEMHDKIFASQ